MYRQVYHNQIQVGRIDNLDPDWTGAQIGNNDSEPNCETVRLQVN